MKNKKKFELIDKAIAMLNCKNGKKAIESHPELQQVGVIKSVCHFSGTINDCKIDNNENKDCKGCGYYY